MDPLSWREGRIRFLDQTRLPAESILTETDDPELIIEAIRCLGVRGAPLIGIAGAYACVLAAKKLVGGSWGELETVMTRIACARPTAVNLPSAVARIKSAALGRSEVVRPQDVDRMEAEAMALHAEDRTACERIAEHGLSLFPNRTSILTHCNTGSLATGGRGTAFGIIREVWESGRLEHLYIDETRPLFQGSRLTAWEAQELGIPCSLITDSTAAYLMRQQRVGAVIVGADRIAENGDVANKVGTYGLAVLARAHGIRFHVAAPTTTIDMRTKNGREIVVEERQPEELTVIGSQRVAPAGIEVYAPAFDITPAILIDSIVTERGVIHSPLDQGLARIMGTTPGS